MDEFEEFGVVSLAEWFPWDVAFCDFPEPSHQVWVFRLEVFEGGSVVVFDGVCQLSEEALFGFFHSTLCMLAGGSLHYVWGGFPG